MPSRWQMHVPQAEDHIEDVPQAEKEKDPIRPKKKPASNIPPPPCGPKLGELLARTVSSAQLDLRENATKKAKISEEQPKEKQPKEEKDLDATKEPEEDLDATKEPEEQDDPEEKDEHGEPQKKKVSKPKAKALLYPDWKDWNLRHAEIIEKMPNELKPPEFNHGEHSYTVPYESCGKLVRIEIHIRTQGLRVSVPKDFLNPYVSYKHSCPEAAWTELKAKLVSYCKAPGENTKPPKGSKR